MTEIVRDAIALKWGNLKRWDIKSDKAQECLDRYFAEPVAYGAAQQENTGTQIQALLDLCDAVAESGGTIYLDWDGVYVDAAEAKQYINEYPR